MTDTPVTPEIRKLAEDIGDLIAKRCLGEMPPYKSVAGRIQRLVEPLVASAITQAVQAERAKRGELIERASQVAKVTLNWLTI